MHLLGILVSTVCNILDIFKSKLQGLEGIFSTEKTFAEIHGIHRKGAATPSDLSTLVNCPIIVRTLCHNPGHHGFDKRMINTIIDVLDEQGLLIFLGS
jgi:hypothetical protein